MIIALGFWYLEKMCVRVIIQPFERYRGWVEGLTNKNPPGDHINILTELKIQLAIDIGAILSCYN